MLNKRLWIIFAGILLLLMIATSALAAPLGQKVSTEKSAVIWQLTNTKVVDPGQTVKIKEGVLTTNYIIEATATSASADAPIQAGTFRLMMSAFSPRVDMPGQKAGRWYIQGLWTVVDAAAKSQIVTGRHSPDAVRGRLSTELDFNPATTKGAFAAKFNMPLSMSAGRWSQGEGTFVFDAQMEGSAKLSVSRRPDVLKALER